MEEDDFLPDEVSIEDPEVSFAEDMEDDETTDNTVGSIVNYVQQRYSRAEKARLAEEQRWIASYRNYRGIYGPEVQFTNTEKSKIFVKVTKTKVLAAYGQIVEVLFGANKFPISIDPTILPEGVAEAVHFDAQPKPPQMEQEELDDNVTRLLPGETMPQLRERLAGLKDKLGPVEDKLVEEEGATPSQITFHPAMVAAKKMEKKIHDQLE